MVSTAERVKVWPRGGRLPQLRLALLAAAVLATTLKLAIAAHTFGTDDVHYWLEFAQGVRDFGPIGIYGHEFVAQYNHAPLSGWLLVLINGLVDHGVAQLPFLFRVPGSLADIITGFVVFELVRGRPAFAHFSTERAAAYAAVVAVLVVWSPVLLVVSGFHGNTDPVFVMFALLSVYLLATRRSAAAAGLAFAAAISVKLVPVVLAPALAVVLVRQGVRRLAAFAGGAAALFLVLWVPVLLVRWSEFRDNVLGYSGISAREWGVVQFATWLDAPTPWVDLLAGSGRFLVILISALVPALLVWRRPGSLAPAAGLGLSLFLLLSPAFGMQYLSWPLAGAYLVSTRAASVYNLAASVLTIAVYSHWNRAYPWDWNEARATLFLPEHLALMVLVWFALASVVVAGAWPLWGRVRARAALALRVSPS